MNNYEDGFTSDDFSIELEAQEELMRLERQILESHDRLRALHTIIALAEGLEESYGDDKLANQQIAKEIRLQAEQLRGNC